MGMQGWRALWLPLMLVNLTSALAAERVEMGNLVGENLPAIREAQRERVQMYGNVRSARFLDWHPDGRGLLISTRFADSQQVHVVHQPLGMRRQLTFHADPVSTAAFQPGAASQGFVFSRDQGGDENFQLYFQDWQSGRVRRLSDGQSRQQNAVWSHSGAFLLFSSNQRDGVNFDIWQHTLEGGDNRLIYTAQGSFAVLDVRADDRQALLRQSISATESRLYLLDLQTGDTTAIDVGASSVAFGEARYAADGQRVYLTLDSDAEVLRLAEYDIATGNLRMLTPDTVWDIGDLDVSPDGQWLAYVSNEEGVDVLRFRRTSDGFTRMGPALPPGVIGRPRFSPDGARIAFTHSAATRAGDVFVYELRSERLQRWTESEAIGVQETQLVQPELIRYPSFDLAGTAPRAIPAFIYRARQPIGKSPVLISIHGGPEAQYRPDWSELPQMLAAEMGITVIAPNVRGSSGYGRSYLELDNGFKREDAVKDIGALLDWIATQPDLDAERVMVMGGSYGGYMTLASMVHYNARLRAGIDTVGISHFVTFLNNTKGYRKDLRRVEYGDERDPEMRAFLERISPLNNATAISKPLLVVQGQNDPRVPMSEAEQIVARVRGNGVPVSYLLAKDEGHGFRKKANRDFYLMTVLAFIEQQLLSADHAATAADVQTRPLPAN